MHAQRETIALTTDGSGDVTAYSSRHVTGRILAVIYTKDDFADGVDFTVTTEETGQSVWAEENVNASKTVLPRQATHSTAGVAAQYADGYPVLEPVVAVNERIKVVVAQGGDTKSGTINVLVG